MEKPPDLPEKNIQSFKNSGDSPCDLDKTLKSLFFQLDEAILIVDPETRTILQTSPRADRMLGYEPGEMAGQNALALYMDQSLFERAGTVISGVFSANRMDYSSLTLRKKDGTLITGDGFIFPFRDPLHEKNRILLLLSSAQTQQAANTLMRYQVLAENTRDIVIYVDAEDGQIIDANRTAIKSYGYTYQELICLKVDQLGKNANAGIKIGRKNYSAGIINEADHCRKDGSEFPVEISIQDAQLGEERILICFIRDITSRRQAEEARRRSEERYHHLFTSLLDGFALCEMVFNEQRAAVDFRFLEVNPAYYEMVGIDQALDGRLGSEISHLILFQHLGVFEKVSNTGEPANFDYYDSDKDRFFHVIVFCPVRGQFATLLTDISNRKKAEARVQRHVRRLEALRSMDAAIVTTFDLKLVIKGLMEHMIAELKADAVDLLMLNVYNQALECLTAQGFNTVSLDQLHARYDDELTARVVDSRSILMVNDLNHSPYSNQRQKLMADEGFVAYCAIPVITKGRVRAVLEAFFRHSLTPDNDWLTYLDMLAGQAAVAVENSELFKGLQQSTVELIHGYEDTLSRWSYSLDKRNQEPEIHTRRVTQLTVRLARRMGMDDEELVHVRRGAMLHDVGKLGIPEAILLKSGALLPEEWNLMRRHPTIAFEILSPVKILQPALDIPYAHHEHWDGSGYPLGLKGNTIPLAARIFCVIDVYDSLCSDRPYRKAWDEKDVLEYIHDQRGILFDPLVVDAFLKMVDESGD